MWNPPKFVVFCSAVGSVAAGGFLFKEWISGPSYLKNNRIDNKIVIITGANTGIGKETTRELAKRGAKVYMACRDMKRCEEARQEIVLETGNKYIYCRPCDLSSLKSIRSFANQFLAEQPRLDILINNAGVMRCPKGLTEDGFEMQLGVNHLGHFLLTNLLLDQLKASAPSRIINVSSLAHTRGEINKNDLNSSNKYDPGVAYNQSKLANIHFTKELAKRLSGTGVTVNAIHPGIVDTELFRHMSFFNSTFASIFVKPLVWFVVKSPRKGAQTTIFTALDPDLETVTGKYFSDCAEKTVAPQALDEQTSSWLWAVSERWTRLNN